MAIKRPTPDEIVMKLRQVEVLMGQGMPQIEAIRQISVTEQNKAWTLAKLPLEATKCSGVRPKSSCSMKSAPAVKSVDTFLELFH